MSFHLAKIISGGQTGADQGGLEAAKTLRLETGGWMPRGWKTEDGPRPAFEDLYGMQEHVSDKYPDRTLANIKEATGTVIFSRQPKSSGTILTVTTCALEGKPVLLMPVQDKEKFKYWIRNMGIIVMNVAGNRESKAPGIQEAVRKFLLSAISEMMNE